MRWLTAIPVFNEARSVAHVLAEVRRYSQCILVVNDGSTDGTARILEHEPGIRVVNHAVNRGYGAALQTAFDYLRKSKYDAIVTMDMDGQHQPHLIPKLIAQLENADIVSGSRYLQEFNTDTPAPNDRRFINATITAELNRQFGLPLTDAFCGFKAYRRSAIEQLQVTEPGYGMPLELWVQAAMLNLRIREIAVPRLYLDASRAFGGSLDDPAARLDYYRRVIEAARESATAASSE